MSTIKLDEQLAEAVLNFLKVKATAPTLLILEKLLATYYCTVPWESVFRIVRRAKTAVHSPRWPDVFWQEAMTQGAGGTCFDWGKRIDTQLNGDVATAVATHFGLKTAVVQQAFKLTQHNYPNE